MSTQSLGVEQPLSPRRTSSEDVVVGFPLGHVSVPARFKAAGFPSPRDAMERVVLEAVSRPPCVVGFSGGRDSSAVLAVAVHVARREGLPSPIPVTRVFADVPASEETEWQELVIRHLGITEWIREPIDDEMDVLGPLAQERLRRHGVLWSPLLHGDDYFLRHAQGGSVLDGEGGDDVCDPAPHRITPLAYMVRERLRPTRGRLRRAARVLAPARLLRRHGEAKRNQELRPWLRPAAYELLAERWLQHVVVEPLDARRSIMLVLRRRAVVDLDHNRGFFAAQHGVRFVSPLLDPLVAGALAARAGRLGFRNRAEGLATVSGDLLPAALLERRTKAEFNATFFSQYTREFADTWSGVGVDPELIDIEVLRDVWRGSSGNALSACLLQTAWLAEENVC
jgi:Asparagine synthase